VQSAKRARIRAYIFGPPKGTIDILPERFFALLGDPCLGRVGYRTMKKRLSNTKFKQNRFIIVTRSDNSIPRGFAVGFQTKNRDMREIGDLLRRPLLTPLGSQIVQGKWWIPFTIPA
jgi:hypothetical protein